MRRHAIIVVLNMATKIKIWNETKLYMRTEWNRKGQIKWGSIIEDRARYLFHYNFKDSEKVFTIHQEELVFTRLPSKPDYTHYFM